MPTAEHCRALAAEADRLAGIVSYTRDKVRLREQAQAWLAKAVELEAVRAAEPGHEASQGVRRWLRRRAG